MLTKNTRAARTEIYVANMDENVALMVPHLSVYNAIKLSYTVRSFTAVILAMSLRVKTVILRTVMSS